MHTVLGTILLESNSDQRIGILPLPKNPFTEPCEMTLLVSRFCAYCLECGCLLPEIVWKQTRRFQARIPVILNVLHNSEELHESSLLYESIRGLSQYWPPPNGIFVSVYWQHSHNLLSCPGCFFFCVHCFRFVILCICISSWSLDRMERRGTKWCIC